MSNRLIKPEYWQFWMGDMLMPEDCTHEQMWAMHDAIEKIEDRDYAAEQIQFLEELKTKYQPRYEMWMKHKDTHPDYQTEYKTLEGIVGMINEQLEFWRKELVA